MLEHSSTRALPPDFALTDETVNLLDYMALARTQIVKLHAELVKAVPVDAALTARMELKLTPTVSGDESPVYQIGVRLAADVRDATDSVFTLELVVNAIYQPYTGESFDTAWFTTFHASLGRQLFPLLHHHIAAELHKFGLHQVRLPLEVIQRQAVVPAAEPDQPRQVH